MTLLANIAKVGCMLVPSLSTLALASCEHRIAPAPNAPASLATEPAPSTASSIELVESWPKETSLDHPDLRDAKDVWLELIDGAKQRLDFAEFYASDDPHAQSALTPIVEAVERALGRGVKVRWLADAKFAKTYPELLEGFARAGANVRRFEVSSSLGGVLHAKYFVADNQAYLGSQNFDWRSLEHIQELGARVSVPEVVRGLSQVFELDWAIASGNIARPAPPLGATGFPVTSDGGQVTFVASPAGWLPDPRLWELPAIVQLIDAAHSSVRAQLLTYRARGGSGGDFPELEGALKRAASRGVTVQLLVSDWSKRAGTVEPLQALQAPPNLTIRFLDIPQASSGFVPFARTAHAKYLVVDGQHAWLGTSNWEREYFYASRNVGLVIDGGPLPARLDAFFTQNWSSTYAEALDPGKKYAPPRVAE